MVKKLRRLGGTPLSLICLSLLFMVSTAEGSSPTVAEKMTKPVSQEQMESNWAFNLGGGVIVGPEFEGSNKYKAAPLLIFDLEYKEFFFISSTRGIGAYLVRNPHWNWGAFMGFRNGRDEDDSDLLKGMGNVDGGLKLGMFLEWTPEPFSVRLKGAQGTGDAKGLELTASLVHTWELEDFLKWNNAVSITYTNSKYNQAFFGVSPEQSRRSKHGYKEYRPGSGMKNVAFSSDLTVSMSERISLLVLGEYSYLVGPAADSPLVKAGSRNQAVGGLGLLYAF